MTYTEKRPGKKTCNHYQRAVCRENMTCRHDSVVVTTVIQLVPQTQNRFATVTGVCLFDEITPQELLQFSGHVLVTVDSFIPNTS